MARLNADGSVDASFGSGGLAAASFGGGDDDADYVTVTPTGRLLVGGTTAAAPTSAAGDTSNGIARIALAAFNADGSPDPTFAANGQEVFEGGVAGGAASPALSSAPSPPASSGRTRRASARSLRRCSGRSCPTGGS